MDRGVPIGSAVPLRSTELYFLTVIGVTHAENSIAVNASHMGVRHVSVTVPGRPWAFEVTDNVRGEARRRVVMGRRGHSDSIRTSCSPVPRRPRSPLTRSLLIVTLVFSLCGLASEAGASTRPLSTHPNGAPFAHAAAVPAFCSRLSVAKIGSIVGGSVTLLQSSVKGKIIACIFGGSDGNISIETETGLPTSSTSTLSGAEKTAKANFPAGLKIKFAATPSIGPTSYSWSAKIAGTPYVGLNTNRGSVGYYVEMQGALKLSVLEKLINYEIATK
jgi:hypothetical protein